MPNVNLNSAIYCNGSIVDEILVFGLPAELRDIFSSKLPRTDVSIKSVKFLYTKHPSLVKRTSSLILVLEKYFSPDVEAWLLESGALATSFTINTVDEFTYFSITDRKSCRVEFLFDEGIFPLLQQQAVLHRSHAGGGSSQLRIPRSEKTLFILKNKLTDIAPLVSTYKKSHPYTTTILLSDIAPTGAQRHSFDYYFVAKPGQLSIDHCTKIFVENIDDLYLYCTSYDKVSLLSQTEDITTLDEVPELSTDNIISTIVRHHLPLTHDDMVGAYVRLLTPNIDKQNDDIKEVDLSSTTTDEEPLDQHILKYCSEPLAHLLKSYGRGNSVYVNTSHHGISNKDGFFELKARFDLKFAFYIHDLIPIEYPEYVRAASYADHEKRMDAVSFVADLVIVNSEASKQSFWSWCDEHKVTKPACEVAYIGVEEQFLEYQADHFSSVLQNALDGDYFVYIGTIEPRKNHLLLLQIWREWVKAGITPPKLVIIGKRGWENQNVFNFLDQCHAIKPYVAELSNLSDASLKKFIKGAAALLFPSFIEGWGMPLVEAQAMGTPVLCSDIPVFHEASAEKATFIDPLDALTWQKTILDFCDPAKDVRYKAKEKLKDYSPPNWEEHFSKVLPLLNSMLQKDARENYPEMT